MITSMFEKTAQLFWQHRDCHVKAHRNMHIVTSGQGHVMTQVGHIAYDSMRHDEINAMRPLPRLYLFWIKSNSQKRLVNLGDPRWPLRVTNENWHLGHRWWPKATPFRVNRNVPMRKRCSLNFAHWHGQVTKLTWSQVTNIQNPRYTSCTNHWPHRVLKVWKHWVQNCGCGCGRM